MPKRSFADWTEAELQLPSEPCYWCGETIRNPDLWPTCGKAKCAANTIRWLLKCFGHVPQAPKLGDGEVLSAEVISFVQDLARPRPDIGPEAFEYVIPPAATRVPLSILPQDRRGFLVWCLESWMGIGHSRELPEYLAFQLERRLARARTSEDMKRSIEGFAKEKRAKLTRIVRKAKKKFDARGVGI